MKINKELLLFVMGAVIGNRIFINLFIPGFTASLSVALIGAFLNIFKKINPLIALPLSGVIATMIRAILEHDMYESLSETITIVAPDVAFLMIYALIYIALNAVAPKKSMHSIVIIIFVCDLISNLSEMMLRIGFQQINYDIFQSLVLVAFVRTMIALGIITIYQYQKTLVLQEEHEARYRNLLLQTASFETELYFMKKGIGEIEDVMKKSFRIYNHLSKNEYVEELKDLALDISKDVHEIKKSYLNRMRGMEKFADPRWKQIGMSVDDLVKIIQEDTDLYIEQEGYHIDFTISTDTNFIMKDHFFYTTIVKNLINNSIDSIGKNRNGSIKCSLKIVQGFIILTVNDTGEGISDKDRAVIFKPGYSSRFDSDTGGISRGLGLTIVKDLVEGHFKGTITFESQVNKGSSFAVTIPENMLRGELI